MLPDDYVAYVIMKRRSTVLVQYEYTTLSVVVLEFTIITVRVYTSKWYRVASKVIIIFLVVLLVEGKQNILRHDSKNVPLQRSSWHQLMLHQDPIVVVVV